jgi:hypothetical protein
MNIAANKSGLGDVLDRRSKINDIYDELVALWTANEPANPQLRSKFMELFRSLVEAPLIPVYLRLGSSFFSWLDT